MQNQCCSKRKKRKEGNAKELRLVSRIESFGRSRKLTTRKVHGILKSSLFSWYTKNDNIDATTREAIREQARMAWKASGG